MSCPPHYPWNVNLDLSARLTLGLLQDPAGTKRTLKYIYQDTDFDKLLDKFVIKQAPGLIDEANNNCSGTFDKAAIISLLDKLYVVFDTNPNWNLEKLYRTDTTGWPPAAADLSRQLVSHGVLLNFLFIPDGIARANAGKFFDNDFGKFSATYSMQELYETSKDPNDIQQVADYVRIVKGLKAGVIRCYPSRTYDHLWPHQSDFGKAVGNKKCCDGTTCVNSQTNPNHYCDLAPGTGCTLGSDEC